MTAPLTPEQIAWWRDCLTHEHWADTGYMTPEIGSMLDEVEASRTKLAAIREQLNAARSGDVHLQVALTRIGVTLDGAA